MTENTRCKLRDINDGNSAAFSINFNGKPKSLLAVRRDNEVFVYFNSCPHTGAPLDIHAGKFLSKEKKHILCSTHGALFKIEDGYCVLVLVDLHI